ncbi:OLC1v1016173C1, partial [Oldenlandia corymbosa var. corymbosa]
LSLSDYITLATIDSVNTEVPWWYLGCNKCNKKVNGVEIFLEELLQLVGKRMVLKWEVSGWN